MACEHLRKIHTWPQAFVLGLNPDRFGKYLMVACGQCRWCRWMLTKEWAVRCCLEAETAGEAAFISLTYRDEDLPKNGSLVKRDLQNFMKRLRLYAEREYGVTNIRFFASGEYGEQNARPHYHVLIFGFDFRDGKFLKWQYRPGIGRYKLFRSDFLERCWKLGFSSYGEVTTASAAYVAGYIRKKVNGEASAEHYGDRIPEFSLSSTAPGIGFEWYEQNKHWLWKEMCVRVGKWSIDPPRYFFKLLRKEDPAAYEAAKERLTALRAERRIGHICLEESDEVSSFVG